MGKPWADGCEAINCPILVYREVTTPVNMSYTSDRVKAWRKATKERMVAAMGGKCQCCGYDRCMESLDFHHVDPLSKEIPLGSIRANPRAWPVIVNELRKCILVCRNCHGEVHYGKRILPETYARFDERYAEYKTHPDLSNECPTCGAMKPIHSLYCSRSCGGKAKIDWDSHDLSSMLATKSIRQIADEIGVSSAAVSKRMKKLNLIRVMKIQKLKRTCVPFVYVKPPKKPKPSRMTDVDPNWRHRPNLKLRKVERPAEEDLKRMVWEKSLVRVGRDYGVTDNTVRKWCKAYGIGLPPQGYHQRRACGYSHEESMVSQKRVTQPKRLITREIAERAYAIVREGKSYRQAAEACGFKHWGMQQAFERYGLETIKRKVAAREGDDPPCTF